jgi:hypothetical protein
MLTAGYGTKLLNARALVCPEELAKADMRPFRRDSAFDPKPTNIPQRSSLLLIEVCYPLASRPWQSAASIRMIE